MIDGVRGVFVKRDVGYDFIEVNLGQEGEGLVEVKSGIEPGDAVVTEGVFDLKMLYSKDQSKAIVINFQVR